MTPHRCHGFSVLPPDRCYAVPWRNWETFFERDKTKEVLELLQHSLIAHVWNKYSIKRKLRTGDGSSYDILAKNHCPRVYEVLDEYF